jgi:hypothetical protein
MRTSINYRCLLGKQQPAFAGLAESPGAFYQGLQDPPHKPQKTGQCGTDSGSLLTPLRVLSE